MPSAANGEPQRAGKSTRCGIIQGRQTRTMTTPPLPRPTTADAGHPPGHRPPRASATLVVVRDGAVGPEVLLLQRAERGDHNSGAWVFPGGVVDPGDRASHALCDGLDDAAASTRLGLPAHGMDYLVAAVRECFEECGLLFAATPDGQLVDGAGARSLHAWRARLHAGQAALGDLCRDAGLRLAVDRLAYLSHWLTPPGRAKRFDTRFFVAEAPHHQQAAADGVEITAHRWLRPADALAQREALKLMGPTQATLTAIARFDSAAAVVAWAAAQAEVPLIAPRIATGAQGLRPVLPHEPAWAEIGRLDPDGRGDVCYDIQPGAAVRLSPRLIRVTANNGSVMTGPGTNTYLVGGGERNEWAVIDPGPDDAAHVDAVLSAAPGPVRWIFATHTHLDHSPATRALQARTGATVHGRVADHPEWQDTGFKPDVPLSGGERFELPGCGATLRALHTPGHASNHLCYLLEEEQLLFTGDHLMQSSTVVINPPDGDMSAYLHSLRRLLDEPLQWLAPGHGFLMAQPRRAIEQVIAHRLKREAKVADALRDLGPAPAEALLPPVYDDVPPRLHGVALRSLKAHLFKLRDDGRAIDTGGLWSLVA